MDPNVALRNLLANIRDFHMTSDPEEQEGLRIDIIDGINALASWLERGGFVPTIPATF